MHLRWRVITTLAKREPLCCCLPFYEKVGRCHINSRFVIKFELVSLYRQRINTDTYCQMGNLLSETYAMDDKISETNPRISDFVKPSTILQLEFVNDLSLQMRKCPHIYGAYILERIFIGRLLTSIMLSLPASWSSLKTAPVPKFAYHAKSLTNCWQHHSQGSNQPCILATCISRIIVNQCIIGRTLTISYGQATCLKTIAMEKRSWRLPCEWRRFCVIKQLYSNSCQFGVSIWPCNVAYCRVCSYEIDDFCQIICWNYPLH